MDETSFFRAIINDLHRIDLSQSELDNLDFVKFDTDKYHFLIENQSYTVEVSLIDRVNRKMSISVNGKHYIINIKNKTDLLIEKLGFDQTDAKQNKNLLSPMPGVIRKIYVEEGESVKKGDPLVMLEAMKMENILNASHDTTIKKIHIVEGETISKNHELIQLN